MARWTLAAGLGLCAAIAGPWASASQPIGGSRAVFERRILPIMRSTSSSSCAECHLSGVDLRDYVRPSEAETFASLVKQGLVDTVAPGKSKLLRLIRMSSPKSSLVTRKIREQEYAAFRDWIAAASRNRNLTTAKPKFLGPKVPVEVIRHTRKDQVLASFERTIWAQKGRCEGCHEAGSPGAARFAKQYSDRVNWIVADDPAATLEKIQAQQLIDVTHPEKSLLLLKPIGAVKHGGGIKFAAGDRSYQLFLSWLQDYAKSVKGVYGDKKSLPPDPETRLVPTGRILEIVDGPEAWIGKSLQVDVFAWDETRSTWTADPLATADRPYSPGHGSLLLLFGIARGTAEDVRFLAPGRYLLRYYLADIPAASGNTAFPSAQKAGYLGSQIIEAQWKPGKEGATKITPNPSLGPGP